MEIETENKNMKRNGKKLFRFGDEDKERKEFYNVSKVLTSFQTISFPSIVKQELENLKRNAIIGFKRRDI